MWEWATQHPWLFTIAVIGLSLSAIDITGNIAKAIIASRIKS